MPKYRLYYMSGEKVEGTDELVAKSDDDAVKLVRARKLPVDCEIWGGDGLVERVPAYET